MLKIYRQSAINLDNIIMNTMIPVVMIMTNAANLSKGAASA